MIKDILSPRPETLAVDLDRKKGMSEPNFKAMSNFSFESKFNFRIELIPSMVLAAFEDPPPIPEE